jgi:hypothetical protein
MPAKSQAQFRLAQAIVHHDPHLKGKGLMPQKVAKEFAQGDYKALPKKVDWNT